MKTRLFRFFDAFIWIPKLLFVVALMWALNVEASPLTCFDWGVEATVIAQKRDAKIKEATLLEAASHVKGTDDDWATRVSIIQGVYENPSLRDAAPETVGKIATLVCKKNKWVE
jgi:hypothetical protein